MQQQRVLSTRLAALFLTACILLNLFPVFEFGSSGGKVSAASFDLDTSYFTTYPISSGGLNATIQQIAENTDEEHWGEGRIILDNDYAENIEIPDNTAIELDLNGHTLSPASGSARANILVYGKLKLSDSAGGGQLFSDGTEDISGIEVLSGGVVAFNAGTVKGYHSSGNGAGMIVEDNGFLSFNGGAIEDCTSDQLGGGVYVYLMSNALFSGGSIENCSAGTGGAIAIYRADKHTELTLEGMNLLNNTATEDGGALYLEYEAVFGLSNTVVQGNRANRGGGLFFNNSVELTIGENSHINGNTSSTHGGGIYFYMETTYTGTTLTLDETSTINENTAGERGGGVYFHTYAPAQRNTVTIRGEICSNKAKNERGGGLYLYQKTDFTLEGGAIDSNEADRYGAGVFLDGGQSGDNVSTFTMNGGSISDNKLTSATNTRDGGGLYLGSRVEATLNSGDICRNSARRGGGIYFSDYNVININDGARINENITTTPNSTGTGGGMYISRGTLFMNGGQINNNTTEYNGEAGGFYMVYGNAYLTGGEIRGNSTRTGHGGGFYANSLSMVEISGDIVIADNTVLNNYYGGGFFISGGKLEIAGEAVIENNKAYHGAGFFSNSGTQLELREDAELRNNTASAYGGGFYMSNANSGFHIKGGRIVNNHASTGGGMFVESRKNETRQYRMTGGEISGNTATGSGGGIYWARTGGNDANGHPAASHTLEISQQAKITDNTANSNGGGVYVSSCSRVELYPGAKVIGNNAKNNGGGFYVDNAGYYERIYLNGNTLADGENEALDIYGGELRDNMASNGREIYVNEGVPDPHYYKAPFFSAVKASSLDNAADSAFWLDENSGTRVTTALSNQAKVENDETPRNSAYTFNALNDPVARIHSVNYTTVQQAIDAIQNGTAGGTEIILLKTHRESFTVPDGVTATLDMSGCSLYAEEKSVITVAQGGDLTLSDSVGGSAVSQGKGNQTDNGKWGGGAYVEGTLRTENVNFSNNVCPTGSAIAVVGGSLYMNGGAIENNRYDANTPTLRGRDCTIELSNVTFDNNQARGVYLNGTNTVTLTDCTFRHFSGNNSTGLWVEGSGTVTAERCLFTENTGGCCGVYANGAAHVYLKNCEIKENNGGTGTGIYISGGRVHLDNTLVTNNSSTAYAGGVFCNGNGTLYMKNARVYANFSRNGGNDLGLDGNAWFINESETDADNRAVESWNLPGYNCWYDDTNNIYYVVDKEQYTIPGANVSNIEGEMVRSNDKRCPGSRYVTATYVSNVVDPVAKIVETGEQFSTLNAALIQAAQREEAVEVRLLKDVAERLSVKSAKAPLTLDFNGHTVQGLYSTNRTFYIEYSEIHLLDRTGGGRLISPENEGDDTKIPRGIELKGAKLTIDDIEISGFRAYNGAAIYCNPGATYNSVFYPTELYIHSGKIIHNHSTYDGGAIYLSSNAANAHSVFEMTGGEISHNYAEHHGGGIYFHCQHNNDYTKITITGGTFDDNYAKGSGGGIYYYGNNNGNLNIVDTDEVIFYGVTMTNNEAAEYGAFYFYRPDNINHPFIFGNSDKKTVFDSNRSRGNYAAGYVQTDKKDALGIYARNLEIKNNRASGGGILQLRSQKLEARDIDFHDNYSVGSTCGMVFIGGELLVEDCEFYRNESRNTSAGFEIANPEVAYSAGTKIVRNCSSHDNIATNGAGMYITVQYDTLFENIEIYDNYAHSCGGGIYLTGTTYPRVFTFQNCHIYDNRADTSAGGGIYTYNFYGGNEVHFRNTIVENNYSGDVGGGCYHTNSGNTIYLEDGTVFRNNESVNAGGGMIIYGANLEVIDTKIYHNTSKNRSGGGIYWSSNSGAGYFKMTGGEIYENHADHYQYGYGGGLALYGYTYNEDTFSHIDIEGGSIHDNTANYGGGVSLGGSSDWRTKTCPIVRITGGTIANNFAKNAGGGIINDSYANDTIMSGTALVTGNYAGSSGGGVYISSNKTNFRLEGGKLYGNRSSLGNDAYVAYYVSYRSSNLYLYKASEMFGSTEEYKGLGWIDENTGAVYTGVILIRPLNKGYPYTLSYRRTNQVVAVYNNTEYTSVTEALEAIANSSSKQGTITMVDDSVESVTIASNLKVRLNLNGHTLTGGGISTITNRGTLDILDDHQSVTVGENTYPQSDAEGVITGTASMTGGGILVKSGKVTMHSGAIADCIAGSNTNNNGYGGGAVAIDGGEFILLNGSLRDNIARYGGAVLVKSPSSVFTMYGGTIENNRTIENGDSTANGYGGGIFCRGGKVNIYGGTIQNNQAYQGGGLYVNSGKVNIAGSSQSTAPVFSGNKAGHSGGGMYFYTGTIVMTNVIIENNRTTMGKNANVRNMDTLCQSTGGGIFTHTSSVDISNGTIIRSNDAYRGGGVYQARGTVLIRGADTVITNNTARLGGGCAQNPLPGNSTTQMTLSENASVYGNRSTLTASGNDFYSAWEGTNSYNDQLGNNANNTPRLNLIPAFEMTVGDRYNVWKNDNYHGASRTGTDLVSGQFVVAEVNMGNNIQITAAYFRADPETILDTNFAISYVRLESIEDGTEYFDNGNQGLMDVSSYEKTAAELLEAGEATLSDETYTFNHAQLHYISYQGKLYEQNQAVAWHPGDDYNAANKIVRSFDNVTYHFSYGTVGDPVDQEYTKAEYNTRLRVKAVLHAPMEEAYFSANDIFNASTVVSVDEHGNTTQTLTGYWKVSITPDKISETREANLIVKVRSMSNGSTIKPEIEFWYEGNKTPAEKCYTETVTVSAAPKYNICVLPNEQLVHKGYFDMENMVEVGEDTFKENPDTIIDGVVLGFGVTLELYNDPVKKNLKGIELPKDELEFDLSFEGKLFNSTQQVVPNAADPPILWAYKENNNSLYGRTIGSEVDIISMNWDDEDFRDRRSYYAYGAAPYNNGNDYQSCYDGGGWSMTRSDKPTTGKESKFHVRVSGFNINCDSKPSHNSGSVSSPQLSSAAVAAFSAGYVQMILPFNKNDAEHKRPGYYQIYMDAVASNLEIKSVTDQSPDEVETASDLTEEKRLKDLAGMNEYYKLDDPEMLVTNGYAVNERRYMDNYTNIVQALRIFNGNQSGNNIGKTNLFEKADHTPINGTNNNDTGRGETPLNSTVFIRGSAYFSSEEIDTTKAGTPYYALNDPLYNAAIFNLMEYNYVTALNLLQKFDADAFSVVGTEAIINEPSGKALTDKLGDNFSISNNESAVSWTNDAITTNYTLTILYAAKPDGSNWSKITNTDSLASPPVQYDDGGAADMDRYSEENLLYFRTLDELHACLGEDAKCVAILYEFRDCVLRSDHSFTAAAKANVTGEFEMVGDTYCTTNDVRAWTTYRPYYKIYYSDKTVAENTYRFNWTDVQYNTGDQTTDPDRYDYTPPYYGTAFPPDEFLQAKYGDETLTHEDFYNDVYTQNGRYPISVSDYTVNYIKTRYRNGSKVGGSHNGMELGNSVLLYSVDTSVYLNVNTKISGTNTVKTDYTITRGERDVQFRVTPKVTIASGATKTALTRNGTQSTEITVTLHIPKYLHFKEGSVVIDYSDVDCGYEEGSMDWLVKSSEETDGSTTIVLTTFVSDIDKNLPEILYDCFIGDPLDPNNDIRDTGTTLTSEAEITAKYYVVNLLAAETHSDSAQITILKTSEDGISETIDNRLAELGEDITFTMSYLNNTPAPVYDIQELSILPHNEDGRNTGFNGGYRVKSISLQFTNLNDLNAFIDDAPASDLPQGKLGLTRQNLRWNPPAGTGTDTQSYLNELYQTVLGQYEVSEGVNEDLLNLMTFTVDEENKTVTFNLPDTPLIVPAYNVTAENTNEAARAAPAVFAEIPFISGESGCHIHVTVTPLNTDNSTLITSGVTPAPEAPDQTPNQQTGGNTYANSFVYRRRTTSNFSVPLISNNVSTSVVKRVLSGVVWMDQDNDGLYNTEDWVAYNNSLPEADPLAVEYPLEGIRVSLMSLPDHNAAPVPANDVFGNPVAPVYTDSKGNYQFENLGAGNYTVVFDDPTDSYQFKTPDPTIPAHPLPFERLCVTNTTNSQAKRGNKSGASYSATGSRLMQASLEDIFVTLPEKEIMASPNYYSPDWNLGMYFIDATIHKHWENMIYGIPEGTSIQFEITGTEETSTNTAYHAVLTMEQPTNNGEVTATYQEDEQPAVSKRLNISGEAPNINWELDPSDRIFLPAENENGRILYTITESSLRTNNRDVRDFYHLFDKELIDPITKQITYEATNSQILGSVTIRKTSTYDEALRGAEFSLYQVTEPGADDAVEFYGSRSGVGEDDHSPLNPANRYDKQTTELYYKVIIGDSTALQNLKELGWYNSETKLLTIPHTSSEEQVIVHKEQKDGQTLYYYHTQNTEAYSYEVHLGGVDVYEQMVAQGLIDDNDKYHYSNGSDYSVQRRGSLDRQFYLNVKVNPASYGKVAILEFTNLPLFNLSGEPIYYTIRETKEPDGYVSLADFRSLTGLDLFNNGKEEPHDFSFTVVNNKEIALPVSGGSGMSLTVLIGSILLSLGSCYFIFRVYQKKKRRGETSP